MSNASAATSRSTPTAARKLVTSRNTMPAMATSTPRPSRKATTRRRSTASTVMTISTAETPTRINEMVPNTNALPASANSADSETSVQKRSSRPGGRSASTFGSALRRR